MEVKLKVQDLSKKYDSFTALEKVSFVLHAGEITILSGPNGSGKTTLLSCMAGIIQPTTGVVTLDGFDFIKDELEVRRRMAYVPDVPRFYLELSAWEHLRFIAMANNAVEGFEGHAEEILKKFGLWHSRHLYPHHYSRGMQLKLGLVFALIRPFEVLLLDEPTSALDQESVTALLDVLQQLRDRDISVLFSSHDTDLAGRIADREMHIEQAVLMEI